MLANAKRTYALTLRTLPCISRGVREAVSITDRSSRTRPQTRRGPTLRATEDRAPSAMAVTGGIEHRGRVATLYRLPCSGQSKGPTGEIGPFNFMRLPEGRKRKPQLPTRQCLFGS